MEPKHFYNNLKLALKEIAEKNNLMDETFILKSTALTTEQAIGKPDRHDFPLMKGKEKLLETEFRGARGQAYTDMPGNWTCTLKEMLNAPVESNFDRAMLIAALNAVCAHLGLCGGTIHCKNNEPEECAAQYLACLKQRYPSASKVGLIGLQPSLLQMLSERYETRAVDLDPDTIGTYQGSVLIEDSEEMAEDLIRWADLLVCTGSTVVNASLTDILALTEAYDKKILFFGTSIAGTAALLGLDRYCPKSV